jgi:hypothetical protein
MWLEFVGLPGVGKTTIINKNLPILSECFKIVESRNPRIFNKVLSRVLYFLRFKYIVNDPQLGKKLAYRASLRFRSRNSDILFFDSGIIQVILENLIQSNLKDIENKLMVLKMFQLPHIVIFIQDDIEKIIDREMLRHERRFNLSRKKLAQRYQQSETIIKSFLNLTVKQVICINSTDYYSNNEILNVKKILQ